MKIDKKLFNKLKQLDRIEFRQKLKMISEVGVSLGDCSWYVMIIWAIFATGSIISWNPALVMLSAITFKIVIFLIILEILFLLLSSQVRKKMKKELYAEYFKTGVKK